MDATKLVLILLAFTIGIGLAKTTFSLPKFTRKISSVDIGSPIDWSKFADTVLIQVMRATDHPLGNTICTGVLVHRRAVLTSAHCADGAQSMTIVFDLENGKAAKNKAIVEKDKIFMHPDYNRARSYYSNDLALLILDQPAQNTIHIRHIPTTYSFDKGDQMIRVGVGMRNGLNMRNVTDPHFVRMKEPGVVEVEDVFAVEGDSGGPIYSEQQELLVIHSTMDRMDGASTPHAYSAYLPYFKAWIDGHLRSVR